MNQKNITLKAIEASMTMLFEGTIREEKFVEQLQDTIKRYFSASSYDYDDLHQMLLNFQYFVENYERINVDWLISEVYSGLYTRVYMPKGKHHEISRLADKYFKTQAKEGKSYE